MQKHAKKIAFLYFFRRITLMKTPATLKKRLAAIGRDRKWLTEVTKYKYDSIMHALSENSPNKSAKILSAIDDAIAQEEKRIGQKDMEANGLFHLEFTPAQFAQVDAASRIVNAASIKEYCQDAVMLRTRELMQRKIVVAAEDEASYG